MKLGEWRSRELGAREGAFEVLVGLRGGFGAGGSD